MALNSAAGSNAVPDEVANRARRLIARRLLPFIFTLYVVNFIDRVNISFAGLDMARDLGFSDEVFGIGAGVFFLSYVAFQIPGALLAERWSARKYIGGVLALWGIVTVLTAAVENVAQFYAARLLLGLAESGFFPAVIVYLSHWFRREDRATAAAIFLAAIPASTIVGGPLAGWLLTLDWLGIDGWRWLFILEGLPAVVLGIITLSYLTDRPSAATWLSADERGWITTALERERGGVRAVRADFWASVRHRQVATLAAAYWLAGTAFYGYNIWLPTIISRTSGVSNLTVGFLAAVPSVLGLLAMIANARHSDRTAERRWHTAAPLLIAGACMAVAISVQENLWLTYGLLVVAGAGTITYLPTFWALPTLYLPATTAAAPIGVITAIGNLGGMTGPAVIGYLSTVTGSFTSGLAFLVVFLVAAAAAVVSLKPWVTPGQNMQS